MSVHGVIPEVSPEAIGHHGLRAYAVRFAFGAAIALVSGIIGMAFGPKLGGVFLAFPAILPASLTLIQKEDGKTEAAIDSIGAILGALALIIFALVVVFAVTKLGVALTLIVSLVTWFFLACILYAVLRWFFPVREPMTDGG